MDSVSTAESLTRFEHFLSESINALRMSSWDKPLRFRVLLASRASNGDSLAFLFF
jgi:hypothetical protein